MCMTVVGHELKASKPDISSLALEDGRVGCCVVALSYPVIPLQSVTGHLRLERGVHTTVNGGQDEASFSLSFRTRCSQTRTVLRHAVPECLAGAKNKKDKE